MGLHVPAFDALTVQDLRRWRLEATHEETLVSYWRRLIQGRLDVLTEHATLGRPVTPEDLAGLLSRHPVTSRGKITDIGATPTGVPDVPGFTARALTGLWNQVPTLDKIPAVVAQLQDAEHALGEYRTRLHALLDESAKELAHRYQDDPDAVRKAWGQRATRQD